MVSMDVPGYVRAPRHAWRIRLDVPRRHILLSLLTGGGASCIVEVYHMAKDFIRPEGVPYGIQETPNTASTAQAVLRIACFSVAALSCLGVHRVRHHGRTARQSRHQEAPSTGASTY